MTFCKLTLFCFHPGMVSLISHQYSVNRRTRVRTCSHVHIETSTQPSKGISWHRGHTVTRSFKISVPPLHTRTTSAFTTASPKRSHNGPAAPGSFAPTTPRTRASSWAATTPPTRALLWVVTTTRNFVLQSLRRSVVVGTQISCLCNKCRRLNMCNHVVKRGAIFFRRGYDSPVYV